MNIYIKTKTKGRTNRAHHDCHTMDNHTIYNKNKTKTKEQNDSQKRKKKREKVESPETTNYVKCTQTH